MKKQIVIVMLLGLITTTFARADLSENSNVPKEEMTFAKNYLSQVRDGNIEFVLRYIDPEIYEELTEEKLEQIVAHFPLGDPISTSLIGSRVNVFDSTWNGNFTFEYEFQSGWVIANVVLKKIENKLTVMGFNVTKTAGSLKELNKFTLSNKSFFQYVILFLTCFVPLFIFVTLIYCIKTPIQERKWLWLLFVLIGVAGITINWTTGAYEIKILRIQLLGAGFSTASEYAPWIFKVSVPIGAIIFWLKRKSLTKNKANK